MAKMVSISDELKEELVKQKEDEGHTSIDSLIRLMRSESDMYRMMKKKEQEE